MIQILGVIAAGFFLLLLVFIAWRYTSVRRGMRGRDEKLIARLDPVARRIESGEAVSAEEIQEVARPPENRFMLFAMLRHFNRIDLLPTNYSSLAAQGESALAYWMMHPNELQDAPEVIELVETIQRKVGDKAAEFLVYRYRMAEGHWAAKKGWLLGLAGPMNPELEPYCESANAFSRTDIDGALSPSELVDWWVEMLRRKGMLQE